MSATIINVLNGKSATPFDEFENSWGTGPAAWDYLIEKYFGNDLITSKERGRRIDALVRDDRLEGDERMVLLFLHDDAYIPLERLQVAAEACETFGTRITDKDLVNHWQDIGRSLRRMAGAKLSRHARGACLTVTDQRDDWSEAGAAERAWSIFKPSGK
jgi:hypothetical protein|nr:hypothetical protein [Neorhizobium tomejilense]